MILKIHRGTKQIGGCITEITSDKGTRIIIDIGVNLPGNAIVRETGLEKLGKIISNR